MRYRIDEIAAALGARYLGAGDVTISGAAEPSMAGPDDLALAMNPAYGDGLKDGRSRAAILWEGADWQALGLEAALFVPRPRYAMAHLTALLDQGPRIDAGIHPSAVIDPSARIGSDPAIGPLVVIGPDAIIGNNARIAAHTVIAENVRIGDDVLLCAGVRIGARVRVGHRFIAQPGAVVGSDGLSFVTPDPSGVEKARKTLGDQGTLSAQSWARIHSLGSVRIGDDVELGANSCIDRGTIRDTTVGSGCKIDNLVHLAHNVELGPDCLLAGQCGIAGSTVIGARCVFGGQSGVADNIRVGDDVIVSGATKLLSNVPAGRVMMGYPAVRMEQSVEMYKALRRLPRLLAGLGKPRSGQTGNKPVSKPGESD